MLPPSPGALLMAGHGIPLTGSGPAMANAACSGNKDSGPSPPAAGPPAATTIIGICDTVLNKTAGVAAVVEEVTRTIPRPVRTLRRRRVGSGAGHRLRVCATRDAGDTATSDGGEPAEAFSALSSDSGGSSSAKGGSRRRARARAAGSRRAGHTRAAAGNMSSGEGKDDDAGGALTPAGGGAGAYHSSAAAGTTSADEEEEGAEEAAEDGGWGSVHGRGCDRNYPRAQRSKAAEKQARGRRADEDAAKSSTAGAKDLAARQRQIGQAHVLAKGPWLRCPHCVMWQYGASEQ